MKTRLLTILFLCIPVIGYAQIDVSIPISVTTDAGLDRTDILHIRIADAAAKAISATDTYDVITAPVPPNSQFDVRLRNPSISSIADATTDARPTPSTVGEIFIFDIIYQPGSGATGTGEVTFSWDPADITAIDEIESLVLKDNIVGSLIGPIDMITSSSFTIDSSSNLFGVDLRLEMSFNDLFLPVELSRFESIVVGNDVRLEWTTASETNNSGFEIQQVSPLESNDWTSMGFVAGNGTTTEENEYAFRIEDLEPGIHHFRLKQIDFDAKFEYSSIIETIVDLPSSHHLSSAYPNPFNPQSSFSLSVKETSEVSIALYDALGKKVRTIYSGSIRGGHSRSFTIDGAGLSSGLYLYRVQGISNSQGKFEESKRLTLIK